MAEFATLQRKRESSAPAVKAPELTGRLRVGTEPERTPAAAEPGRSRFGHEFGKIAILSGAQRAQMTAGSAAQPAISAAPGPMLARDPDNSSGSVSSGGSSSTDASSQNSSQDNSSASQSSPDNSTSNSDQSSSDNSTNSSSSTASGPNPSEPTTCSQDPGGTAAAAPDNGDCSPSPDIPAPCAPTDDSGTPPTGGDSDGAGPVGSDGTPAANQSVAPNQSVAASVSEPNQSSADDQSGTFTNTDSSPALGTASSSSGGDIGSGSGAAPDAPLQNGDGLSTGANDALGTALGVAGMVPGPIGTVATAAGLAQTAATAPSDPSDPNYKNDQMVTGLNAGLGAASLLGMEAAGPLGLVAAGGMALGHGAQVVGNEMIEQGMQKNPGNFGPDPFDSLGGGQGY